MAETQNNDIGTLEKLALLADSVQNLFSGKTTILFELPKEEYLKVINHFREIDRSHKRFTIEISGTDFAFMMIEPSSEDKL
jgi:hypothetical protein